MKVKLFFIMLFLSSVTANAQFEGLKMHVQLKDGADSAFFIDSIAKITYHVTTAPPAHTVQQNWISPRPVGNGIETPGQAIDRIDSIRFSALKRDNADTLFFEYFDSAYRTQFLIEPHRVNASELRYFALDSLTYGLDTIILDSGVIHLPNEYRIHSYDETENFRSVAWFDDQVFGAGPVRRYTLDSSLQLLQDSILDKKEDSTSLGQWSITLSDNRKLLLTVSSVNDASIGWLRQINLSTNIRQILDTNNISSALYWSNSDSILFYSYGSHSKSNPFPKDAGYYSLNQSGKKTLVLNLISTLGPYEVINGFDISHDNKKLLLGATALEHAPNIIEYDLQKHTFDTIFKFNSPSSRPNLWVRYSHDGTRILYCNYGLNPFSEPSDTSEVGIVNLQTRSKRILTMCEGTSCEGRVYLFPQWSPDDSKIVYIATTIAKEPPGSVGAYTIEIQKKLR